MTKEKGRGAETIAGPNGTDRFLRAYASRDERRLGQFFAIGEESCDATAFGVRPDLEDCNLAIDVIFSVCGGMLVDCDVRGSLSWPP